MPTGGRQSPLVRDKTDTMTKKTDLPEPRELELETEDFIPRQSVGLLGNNPGSAETRFMITPEGCGVISSDFKVLMETKAASDINFSDEDYVDYGVKIATRKDVLSCDIVLSFSPLKISDIKKKMNPGSTLICFSDDSLFEKETINALSSRNITKICLDSVASHNDEYVFANVLDEVDGRTSIFYAAEALSYLGKGRGTLLAGVAGIAPCKVLIIGSGSRVQYAAKTAMSLGADVTFMDNDVSALQVARMVVGDNLVTAAINPRILTEKVTRADVIILDSCTRNFEFPKKLSLAMKEDVFILDFQKTSPSVSVPRTVAMALTTPVVNLLSDFVLKNGVENAIALTPGLQEGVVTYHGQLVNKLVGSCLQMPSTDIRMMFAEPN